MIYRLNLDRVAAVYPYEYRDFSEAYSAFEDVHSGCGDIGEHGRIVATAATSPGYPVDGEADSALVEAVVGIVGRFSGDGISVYPAVLDTGSRFELFFGVENPTGDLLDLMGGNAVTEEYAEGPDIFVAW